MSCPSASACTAVGYDDDSSGTLVTLAEGWNGAAWTVQDTPNPSGALSSLLSGVSCTSASACTAVGSSNKVTSATLAESWNGSVWKIKTTPNPSGASSGSALYSVSCASASACTAVGYGSTFSNTLTLAESWNGTAWTIQTTPNPSGAEASVLRGVSCPSATSCTAVGFSESSSETEVTLAEAWNSTAWKVKTTPNPTGATDNVLYGVSCTSPTNCAAVGTSDNSSGIAVTLAEKWNGTAWKVKSTPNAIGATYSFLSAVSCPSASACTAVGSDETSAENLVTLGEAWNDTAWSIQSTANPSGAADSGLNGVSCTSATSCTAVGSADSVTLAEVRNGTTWKVKTTPNPTGATYSVLNAVSCPSATACTAVGWYDSSSGITVTLAEVWNGTAWKVKTTPNPTGATSSVLNGVSCTSATACTAVGYSENSSDAEVTLAEKWNGTAWTIQATPDPSGATYSVLNGVSCPSATACTAVGYSENSSDAEVTLAEKWNGTAWTIQATPDPSGASASGLDGVSCTSATACTAVGSSEDSSDTSSTLAEGWDGTAWTIQTTPSPAGGGNSLLESLSCSSASACTAIGYSETDSGGSLTLAEKWNGTAWTVQTTPDPTGAAFSVLDAVSCTAATACTAVGDYATDSYVELTLAEVEGG